MTGYPYSVTRIIPSTFLDKINGPRKRFWFECNINIYYYVGSDDVVSLFIFGGLIVICIILSIFRSFNLNFVHGMMFVIAASALVCDK